MKQKLILILFLLSMATSTLSFAQSYNSNISEREKNDCLFMIHAVSKVFTSRPDSTTDEGIQKYFVRNYNLIKELRDYATVRDYNPEIIDFLNSNLNFYAKCYNLITEIINLKNRDYSEEIQQGAKNASFNAGYNIGQATAANGGTVGDAMALSMLAGPFAAAAGAENVKNEIIRRVNTRSQENVNEMTRTIRQTAQSNMSKINLIRRKMNWPMYYGGAMTYTPYLSDNPNSSYPLDGPDLAQYSKVQFKTNPFARAELLKGHLNNMTSKEYADEQIQKCIDLIPPGNVFNRYRQEIKNSLVYDVTSFSKPGMKIYLDNEGIISELQSQDGKGNLVPNPDSSKGDVISFIYLDDGSSQITETFRFAKGDNRLYSRITILNKNGYAVKVIHKNENGDYFKLNNNIVGWTFINDNNGNPVCMKYIDKDGNASPDSSGVCEERRKFNSAGQLVMATFHDKNGNLCVDKEKIAGYEIEYDASGNLQKHPLDNNLNRISPCVLIKEVLPNSEAARVGIKAGDVIVKYNNKTVRSVDDFIELTDMSEMWKTLSSDNDANSDDAEKKTIIINHNGKVKEFKVKPGKIGVKIRNATLPPEMRKPI
ncbi:MAG: hypothetical protein IJQ39_08800 [Thermoguttaceae bacterium]|nr:hypothetical protein [Thermoguttaceae bacterium]